VEDLPRPGSIESPAPIRPLGWRGPDWAWILGAAALVRALAFLGYDMLGTDGMHYLTMAEQIDRGDVFLAWAHPLRYHPGYPTLIALAHGLGLGWEAAGLAVSFAAGVLLTLPIYHLARWAYGNNAGLLAGLLAAFHPALIDLSTDVMTETSCFLFQGAAIAFLARGLQTRSWVAWTAAGAASAGALWIRAEGIYSAALIGAAGLVAAVIDVRRDRRAALGTALRACAALAVLAVFFAPYINWVHDRTGRWHFTTKGSAYFGTQALVSRVEIGPDAHPISLPGLLRGFGRAAPWVLVPWMAVGLAAAGRRRAWNAPAAVTLGLGILGCTGAIAAHLITHYAVSRRYFLQGAVFLLPLAGFGLAAAAAWAAARWPSRPAAARALAAAGLGVLLAIFVARFASHSPTERIALREAGEWVLATYGPRQWMMTRQEQPAFYAKTWPQTVPRACAAIESELTVAPGRLFVLFEKDLATYERSDPGFRARIDSGPLTCVGQFPRQPTPRSARVWVYRSGSR
jgi:4-amino-4-deoxy-L-arabinose transferase-like glycosyltransferase